MSDDKQHLLSPQQQAYSTVDYQYQQAPPQVYYPTQQQYPPQPQPVHVSSATSAPPDHHHHHHDHHQHFGVLPQNHVCQWCGVQGVTHTDYSPGVMTYLASGACLLVGCWMGCCLIPCCIEELKDVDHYCPSCHQQVGKYTRI